jgi:uncharacterized membrane protein YedE/YeeE
VRPLIAVVSGALFASGLVVSGMTLPAKVQGFLDFTGAWDPSLALVMGGAVSVYAVTWTLVRRMKRPLAGDGFIVPTNRTIDARLIAGAAIFGVGWGLSGYCPGPAVVAASTGTAPALVYLAAMLAGMVLRDLQARATAVLVPAGE